MIKKSMIKGMQVLCTSWKKSIHIYTHNNINIIYIYILIYNKKNNIKFIKYYTQYIHVNKNFYSVKIRYLHKNFKIEKYLYFLK